jgi:hypothetical protein
VQEVYHDFPSSTAQGAPCLQQHHGYWFGILSSFCLQCSCEIYRYELFLILHSLITNVHYAGMPICSVDLTFCQAHVKSILDTSPVLYIRDMQLCGTLFEDDCNTSAISSVFTNFFVDHCEPLAALTIYKASSGWILGDLLEGFSFYPPALQWLLPLTQMYFFDN